jgi:hypothetical protein
VYSVEIHSVVGGPPAFISGLSYAKDGEHINGFDIDLATFRYGSDQHSFDPQMEKAGLLSQDGPRRKAAVGDFV